MSPETNNTRLLNKSTHPVELHFSTGVVVVPAQSDVTCDSSEAESGQIQALAKAGVLAVRPVPDERPAPTSRRSRGSGNNPA